MSNFYVYELWNPISNNIFYVGKGTTNNGKYKRLYEHIKDSKYYKDGKIRKTHKFTIINKILSNGLQPTIKIVFESNVEMDCINKEIELIKFYGRKDNGTGILANHTDGGDGMSGWNHSEKHKQKLRTYNKGGEATAIPVAQICINTGTIIAFHKSARQAGILITNKKEAKANICAACKKKTTAPYGFYWRYIDDAELIDGRINIEHLNKWRASSKSGKSVVQLDKDKNIIKTWDSASEACQHYELHVSTLWKYLKTGKLRDGFYWQYIETDK